VDEQPAGRFVYEYDSVPYPPAVMTVNVTLSPASTLVREAVKDEIERAELTVMLSVSPLEA
jgi:hypothetical protein